MDPLTLGLAGGAGIGLLRSLLMGGPQEKADAKMLAMEQRMSPYGQQIRTKIRENDPFGEMLAGGLAGGQMGQGYAKYQSDLGKANYYDMLSRTRQAGRALPEEVV